MRLLAVIDRDGPAVAEECTDLLAFCVGLRVNFGGLDLVLRGGAVTCALQAAAGIADPHQTTRGPRRYLEGLLRSGVQVWADEADLNSAGHGGKPLVAGVTCTDTNTLAVTWPTYDKVWFL